jgi:hypothetical protein
MYDKKKRKKAQKVINPHCCKVKKALIPLTGYTVE